jgi:hypothetical protein
VGFVLPAEYGVDPTGIGKVLGLTRMGEIKRQLANEADAEAAAAAGAQVAGEATSAGNSPNEATPTVSPVPDVASIPETRGDGWRDEMTVSIAPDEAIELKLVMKSGEQAEFEWAAESGALNFNMHGDGGGQKVTYETGRGAQDGAGVLTASFDGHHGWFWRNRTSGAVSLTLRTRGQYAELKRTH